MPDNGREFSSTRVLRGPPSFDGIEASRDMLRSDIPLSQKWVYDPSTWGPGGLNYMRFPTQDEVDESDIEALRDEVQGLDANHVIPPAKGKDEEKTSDDGVETSVKWLSGELSTEDGGVKDEYSRTKSRDLRTGETTKTKKHTVDSDFGGKWKKKPDFTIVKADGKVSTSIADGEFGDENSNFSGEGAAFSAVSGYEGSASFGEKGGKIRGAGKASASMLEGNIKTNQDGLVRGGTKGAVAKAEIEASGEIVLSADEAVAKGKVGGSANIIEWSIDGEICYTPRRIVNFYVSGYNWIVNEDYEGLGDDWDIGFCAGGEAGLAVGAQAGAEAEIGYKDGRASWETGAKLGMGVGASAKVKGGAIGLDKAVQKIRDVWD